MRKLSWIVAGILCTTPVFVHAAQLGEAKIASHLTERLNVKIPLSGLNGVALDQVKVRLAPEKYYQQAGLSLDGLSGNITFQITSEGKRDYVVVRSKRAISDPILSLLIQVNAGNGSQVKEYDLLLNPPVHKEHRASKATQNSFTGTAAAPSAQSRPVQSSPAWKPVANVPDVKMGGTYQVKKGDTLYEIAKTAATGKPISVRPMMQAIINANPGAFVDGNGNLLKAGSKLKVPERIDAKAVSGAGADKTSSTTNKPSNGDSSQTASTEAKPKLQLLGVDSDKDQAAGATPQTSGSAAELATGSTLSGVLPAIDTPTTSTADNAQQNNEAIASIDAKSQEMSKQISMLNDQLKQVQGLVSQRNQNIEQLQQKIKESNEQTQLLKKQLEAQNNNFWLKWAPYLMGGAGLIIIVLLLLAMSGGRKRKAAESTAYSTVATGAATTVADAATKQPKAEVEPQVVEMAAPKVPVAPTARSAAEPKSVIDEARLLFSYNLHAQAFDLIEEAIADQPNELSFYQELARMHAEANNTSECENVLARIDEKFGSEHRPTIEEHDVYAPQPAEIPETSASVAPTPAEESAVEPPAPTEPDALDAIPDNAFAFDYDLEMPKPASEDTPLDFDVAPHHQEESENPALHDPEESKTEDDFGALSLQGGDERAAIPDTIDLELSDNFSEAAHTPEAVNTEEVSLPETEPQNETATDADTRLGLAEAFLSVGDEESYQMIAEEIKAEGNPALTAALSKIEQKFS